MGIWNSIKNFFSGNSGGLVSATIGAIGAAKQRKFEQVEAQKERDWSEQMQQQQNMWNLEQWNRTNEYNSPTEQRRRLEDAGLNPLYYGLDGSSASGLESAQPLGYERASMAGVDNPLKAGLEAFNQNRTIEAQIDLAEAQAAEHRSRASGQELDNQFMKETMAAREEGVTLSNDLTKEQLSKVSDERKQIAVNISKIIAETDNELERKTLIMAERNLKDIEAKQIVELLPYQKLFTQAQTENQKAMASLSFAQAAIQKGLIDRGYIDLQIEQLDQLARKAGVDADNADAIKQINAFKSAIKTGNWSDELNLDKSTAVGRVVGNLLDSVYGSMSAIAEAVAGPLSGFIR